MSFISDRRDEMAVTGAATMTIPAARRSGPTASGRGRCGGDSRRAFTLIELLVVISIIALLIALLLPALRQAREVAKSSECLANQRSLSLAVLNYSSDHYGLMPIAYDGTNASGSDAWLPARLTASGYLPRVYDYMARGLYICPSTREQEGGATAGRFTIGYNANYLYGRYYTPGSTFDTYKRLDAIVKHPSATLMFLDAETLSLSSYQVFLSWSDDSVATLLGYPKFRHHSAINVAYNDGHASAVKQDLYDQQYKTGKPQVARFWGGK